MRGGDVGRDRLGDPCMLSAPPHPKRCIGGVSASSKAGRTRAVPQAQTQSGWARAGAHREDGPEVVEQLDVPRDARAGPVDHVALAVRGWRERPARTRLQRAQRGGSAAPQRRESTAPDHALLSGVVQRHEELRLLADVADEVAHAEVEAVGGRSRQACAAARLALLRALQGKRLLSPTRSTGLWGTAVCSAMDTWHVGVGATLTVSSWMRCVTVCAALLCAWKRLMMLVLSGSRMFSSSSRTTRSSARILQRGVRWDPEPGWAICGAVCPSRTRRQGAASTAQGRAVLEVTASSRAAGWGQQ